MTTGLRRLLVCKKLFLLLFSYKITGVVFKKKEMNFLFICSLNFLSIFLIIFPNAYSYKTSDGLIGKREALAFLNSNPTRDLDVTEFFQTDLTTHEIYADSEYNVVTSLSLRTFTDLYDMIDFSRQYSAKKKWKFKLKDLKRLSRHPGTNNVQQS
jgi:hypothetical protein